MTSVLLFLHVGSSSLLYFPYSFLTSMVLSSVPKMVKWHQISRGVQRQQPYLRMYALGV